LLPGASRPVLVRAQGTTGNGSGQLRAQGFRAGAAGLGLVRQGEQASPPAAQIHCCCCRAKPLGGELGLGRIAGRAPFREAFLAAPAAGPPGRGRRSCSCLAVWRPLAVRFAQRRHGVQQPRSRWRGLHCGPKRSLARDVRGAGPCQQGVAAFAGGFRLKQPVGLASRSCCSPFPALSLVSADAWAPGAAFGPRALRSSLFKGQAAFRAGPAGRVLVGPFQRPFGWVSGFEPFLEAGAAACRRGPKGPGWGRPSSGAEGGSFGAAGGSLPKTGARMSARKWCAPQLGSSTPPGSGRPTRALAISSSNASSAASGSNPRFVGREKLRPKLSWSAALLPGLPAAVPSAPLMDLAQQSRIEGWTDRGQRGPSRASGAGQVFKDRVVREGGTLGKHVGVRWAYKAESKLPGARPTRFRHPPAAVPPRPRFQGPLQPLPLLPPLELCGAGGILVERARGGKR